MLLSPNHKFVVTSEPYHMNGYTTVDLLECEGYLEADTNRDGVVSHAEAALINAKPTGVAALDTNKDGFISTTEASSARGEELEQLMKMQRSQAGLGLGSVVKVHDTFVS